MTKKIIFINSFIDKTCKNKNGDIVLIQAPNAIAYIWLFTNITMIFANGELLKFLEIISFGSLFTWCWLEITQGVNYFRKALGIIVLIMAISNRLN